MAAIVQQLIWELARADLEALLTEAGSNYTNLQFKMCIDDTGATKYYVSLVKGSTAAQTTSAALSGLEKEACPVPPGCQ